jgi:hypothetical protein
MQLTNVTFTGPPADDVELLERLPRDLAELFRQLNGFIAFDGGLHVRGACREPAWHSLWDAWLGETAFHQLYPRVHPEDIPFAEDCMGDQFLLRAGQVWRLAAETGEVEPLGLGLGEFLQQAQSDPVDSLSLQPLLQFQQEGGRLEPGQLLASFPPCCAQESVETVCLAAVATDERRRFLARLAAQLRDVPDGGTIEFRLMD